MCKEYGGLGIPKLRDLNICLLASWLKSFLITTLVILIFFRLGLRELQVFSKVSCGLPKWQEWATFGG